MTIPDVLLALSDSTELSLIAKATVLLTLGLAGAWLAARAKASLRSLVLGVTFAALLALPAAGVRSQRGCIDPMSQTKPEHVAARKHFGQRMMGAWLQHHVACGPQRLQCGRAEAVRLGDPYHRSLAHRCT